MIASLATSPDCPTVDPLPPDDGTLPWLHSDVQSVLDKLKEICPDNDFSDIDLSKPWNSKWIDEIYAAMAKGCCGDCCPSCCASDEVTITVFTCPNMGTNWAPDCDGNYTWGGGHPGIGATLGARIDGLTAARKHTENLNWQLLYVYTTYRNPSTRTSTIAAGTVNDDGKIHVDPSMMTWPLPLSGAPGPVFSNWGTCWQTSGGCVCSTLSDPIPPGSLDYMDVYTSGVYKLVLTCATYSKNCP